MLQIIITIRSQYYQVGVKRVSLSLFIRSIIITMAIQKPSDKRHKKMLRRNLEGLLSKVYKYGNLQGVELGLYVNYMEKNEFVSYETGGFLYEEIGEKVRTRPVAIIMLRGITDCYDRKDGPMRRTIHQKTRGSYDL